MKSHLISAAQMGSLLLPTSGSEVLGYLWAAKEEVSLFIVWLVHRIMVTHLEKNGSISYLFCPGVNDLRESGPQPLEGILLLSRL